MYLQTRPNLIALKNSKEKNRLKPELEAKNPRSTFQFLSQTY